MSAPFPSTIPDDERAEVVAGMVAKGMSEAEANTTIDEALAAAKAAGVPGWDEVMGQGDDNGAQV